MSEIFSEIWFFIFILPYIMFQEGTKKFAAFLKKKNIYQGWDMLHSLVVLLIIFLLILLGARYL